MELRNLALSYYYRIHRLGNSPCIPLQCHLTFPLLPTAIFDIYFSLIFYLASSMLASFPFAIYSVQQDAD